MQVFPGQGNERGSNTDIPHGDRVVCAGGEGRRVLLVEDEWLVASEIELILAEAGYEVTGTADRADEAIRLAASSVPEVVLMDIRLRGGRDGIDAAIEIYRRFGIRCLFVSAHVDRASRERAGAATPLGWVPKPFSREQLLDALSKAFRGG